MRIVLWLILVLIAFAGNSVLARLALEAGTIGPWSFSLLRFVSGALILVLLCRGAAWASGRWRAALALCAYGVFFSYAYLQLPTGTGALLLFASVQMTMLGWAVSQGEQLSLRQALGCGLALLGLAFLLKPGLNAPPVFWAGLMVLSGIGWGAYSVLGKGDGDPTARTAGNFARAALLLLALSPLILIQLPEARPAWSGIALAVLSGTLTSALGYALWYRVLRDITVTTASISQLMVPVIAAIGGAIFVFEPVTWSFALSCAVVLFGVALATLKSSPSSGPQHPPHPHVDPQR
jgi:drug/metabolite transporter (DMT)-like permease